MNLALLAKCILFPFACSASGEMLHELMCMTNEIQQCSSFKTAVAETWSVTVTIKRSKKFGEK